jgi:hypothetical protein
MLDSREWRMEIGDWRMENGEWRLETGKIAGSLVS